MSQAVLTDRYPAPCVHEGPLAPSAQALLDASEKLGDTAAAYTLRAWSVPLLFGEMERAFASGDKPTPLIVNAFERVRSAFNAMNGAGLSKLGAPGARQDDGATAATIAPVTGQHYGHLFREFSVSSFLQEPAALLRARLERNRIDRTRWEGQRVLDAGCGGGRYSAAWRLLGAGEVVGLDVSETGIEDARHRVRAAGIEHCEFQTGNVLDLPFKDGEFDVVFSNGVLHHTVDWQAGVRELVRVLRVGGLGWLYLIENPGGLFWDVIEVMRQIMRGADRETARRQLAVLGIPSNRIFYMLDHVMVPINVRLTPDEVEGALREAGAVNIRRLERGADFDRVETIYRGAPYAEEAYGVGENRYVFSK